MPENAAAPAGEAAPSESVANTNPNPAPAAPEASAPAPAPEAPSNPYSVEEAMAIKRFLDSNGGLDGVKRTISARQPQPQPQPQPQAQIPQPNPLTDVPQPSQPQQPNVPGGFTQQEFAIQQYFSALADRPEYASIAGDIRNGNILNEFKKFNIQPLINGVFNDRQVNDFLSLYAKTVPAPTPEAPVTSTPTVDLVQVGETITNMNDAMNVIRQDRELKAMGREGHPMAAQANEFFDKALSARQNAGKREHKTLDPKA